jgi:SAM-dependent methyltransferase
MPAPIALFVYKRPHHTRKTLEALARNELAGQSVLYVFADGPKPGATKADLHALAEVRALVRERAWCGEVHLIEAEQNLGLAGSVIAGVTRTVGQHGRVIVLEDDLVTSPHFLRYMNDALDFYADQPKVVAIHGYMYPVAAPRPETFFLREVGSWGWATWQRGWDLFEPDAQKLLDALLAKGLDQDFDYGGAYPYTNILRDQTKGGVDAWAIRWYASAFLHKKLVLWPGQSLVQNIGNDNSGVHSFATTKYDVALAQGPVVPRPIPLEEHRALQAAIRHFFVHSTSSRLAQWRAKATAVARRVGHGLRVRRQMLAAKVASWFRSPEPLSRDFGFTFGDPVDRFYIKKFLAENRRYITGVAMEIAESDYLQQFGQGVARYEVLHVDPEAEKATLIGNLTDPPSLPADYVDCFVCTQTLNVIYDYRSAIAGIHRLLKPGGTALVTVPGITQLSRFDADRWGDYWRFTPQSAQKIFTEIFGEGQVQVDFYGNWLAASALLQGKAIHMLTERELMHQDPDYPAIITIIAKKKRE